MRAGREIKFRAWDNREQKMLSWEQIDARDKMDAPAFLDMLNDKNYAVMQFTGLRDSTKWDQLTEDERSEWTRKGNLPSEWRGKEIYEGDVVRLEDCGDIFDHVVKWIPEECRFVFETTEDWYGPEEMDFDFCKVIGNVWENLELLEVGKQ